MPETDAIDLPGAEALGREAVARLDRLAEISERPDALTRRFGTPEHARALVLIEDWMRAAGMSVRRDAAANLIGRYEGAEANAPALMMGSHQDTVRDAGRFDGLLGIVLPILAVETLHRAGRRLPVAVEIVAFCDEEGVRFRTTLLGSKAVTGRLGPDELEARDEDGRTVADVLRAFGGDPDALATAARRPGEIAAYVETHIEQGPVLEAAGLPVGVVTAIVGGTRLQVTFEGEAGHAGTVPMARRRDALAAAAEAILETEALAAAAGDGAVATVGRIDVEPGAINVIPGRARFTVDLRLPDDEARARAGEELVRRLDAVAARRGCPATVETLYESDGAAAAPWLMDALGAAIAAEGLPVRRLPSGAGHDAMAMAELTDIAMLFVRCRGGISHNPAESAEPADIGTAGRVLLRLLDRFALPEPDA